MADMLGLFALTTGHYAAGVYFNKNWFGKKKLRDEKKLKEEKKNKIYKHFQNHLLTHTIAKAF